MAIAIPNRKNLIFSKHLSHYEWATKQRSTGVGGSEVATLFGLNDFTTQIELFYNKVKLIAPMPDNTATYSGRVMEDIIAKKYFVFYDPTDPTDETMLRNANANNGEGLEIRNIERFTQVMQMKNHPIVLNVDRLVKDKFIPEGGVIEIKNLLKWVVRQYEAEILPSHLIQLQTYFIGTGFKRGYLVYLLDGREFKCYEIEANDNIQGAIIEKTEQFWVIVKKGREIWNDPTLSETDKALHLYKLEPPMESNESLSKFLNLRFKEAGKLGKMMVTEEIQGYIDKYKEHRIREGAACADKDLFGNHLRSVMLAHKVDEITNKDNKVIASNRESDKKPGSFTLRVN